MLHNSSAKNLLEDPHHHASWHLAWMDETEIGVIQIKFTIHLNWLAESRKDCPKEREWRRRLSPPPKKKVNNNNNNGCRISIRIRSGFNFGKENNRIRNWATESWRKVPPRDAYHLSPEESGNVTSRDPHDVISLSLPPIPNPTSSHPQASQRIQENPRESTRTINIAVCTHRSLVAAIESERISKHLRESLLRIPENQNVAVVPVRLERPPLTSIQLWIPKFHRWKFAPLPRTCRFHSPLSDTVPPVRKPTLSCVVYFKNIASFNHMKYELYLQTVSLNLKKKLHAWFKSLNSFCFETWTSR